MDLKFSFLFMPLIVQNYSPFVCLIDFVIQQKLIKRVERFCLSYYLFWDMYIIIVVQKSFGLGPCKKSWVVLSVMVIIIKSKRVHYDTIGSKSFFKQGNANINFLSLKPFNTQTIPR